MRDYIALTKPRITWLILMSTGVGYFFGLTGQPIWLRSQLDSAAAHADRHGADRFRHRGAESVV